MPPHHHSSPHHPHPPHPPHPGPHPLCHPRVHPNQPGPPGVRLHHSHAAPPPPGIDVWPPNSSTLPPAPPGTTHPPSPWAPGTPGGGGPPILQQPQPHPPGFEPPDLHHREDNFDNVIRGNSEFDACRLGRNKKKKGKKNNGNNKTLNNLANSFNDDGGDDKFGCNSSDFVSSPRIGQGHPHPYQDHLPIEDKPFCDRRKTSSPAADSNGLQNGRQSEMDIEDDRMSLDSVSSGEERLEVNPPNGIKKSLNSTNNWLPSSNYDGFSNHNSIFDSDYDAEAEYVTQMFSHVLGEFVTELKSIMQRDLCKKMVETSAFKYFEKWWDQQEQLHKVSCTPQLCCSSPRTLVYMVIVIFIITITILLLILIIIIIITIISRIYFFIALFLC